MRVAKRGILFKVYRGWVVFLVGKKMGLFFELVLELRVANGGDLVKATRGLPIYQRHARTDGPGPWALAGGRRATGGGRRANR